MIYTGDCCSSTDCISPETCASHVCSEPGPIADTYTNINDIIYDGQEDLSVWSWSDPANPHKLANTIIIKADLNQIPQGSSVTEARLELYQTGTSGLSTYSTTIHSIINKNPVISEVTGYDASATEQWTAVLPGTTYNNVPLGLADIGPVEDSLVLDSLSGTKTYIITNMVQNWVNNPSTNFGMLIKGEETDSETGRIFASSENSNTLIRPNLIVNYSSGTTCSPADNNPTNGVVSITELMSYISQWKSGSVTISELMTAIGEWKNGC